MSLDKLLKDIDNYIENSKIAAVQCRDGAQAASYRQNAQNLCYIHDDLTRMFCPSEPDKKHSPFVEGYIKCALWSSTDEDGESLDKCFGEQDISRSTLNKMIADCVRFQRVNEDLLAEYYRTGLTEERAGIDFWLTRNGHGAGFWDKMLGELGDKLTAASKLFNTCDLYVGDNGEIYCS